MESDPVTIRKKTLKAWRFLYRRGFIEGVGHISARLPGGGEFPIHLEIHKARPEVGSIIHYDGLYATAFTTSALMRAHGVVAAGFDVEEAVAAAFPLEENAHRAWVSAALGGPVWLDEKTVAEAGDELTRSRGPFRRVRAMVESDAGEA